MTRRDGRSSSGRPDSSTWLCRATAAFAGSRTLAIRSTSSLSQRRSRQAIRASCNKAGIEAEIARLERLRASHFDDQHAFRRKIASAESALAHAKRRIGEVEIDLTQRTPTRGDEFVMKVEGRMFAERKTAGDAFLKAIRHYEFKGDAGEWPLATIGSFDIAFTLTAFRKGPPRHRTDDAAQRRRTDIEFDHELTALGIISRLEYALSRFEAELAQYQRIAAENTDWLPPYRQQLGRTFPFEDELADKRQELDALEASLAATAADFRRRG